MRQFKQIFRLLIIFSLLCGSIGFAKSKKDMKRRKDSVIYAMKDGATATEKKALSKVLKKHHLKKIKNLVKGKAHLSKASKKMLMSEEDVSADIMATGAVEYAIPDYAAELDSVPNDFVDTDEYEKVNMLNAWGFTTGSQSIKVGVCDTGVRSTHPDLAANLKLPGYNTVDNSTDVTAENSHGMNISGIIGAVGNNKQYHAGINWQVSIIPVKVTSGNSGIAFYSDMAECITWLADQGARVVNLSINTTGGPQIFNTAAIYLRSKNGLLIASAGNANENLTGYPDYSSYLLVGATNRNNSRASFSNYGTAIDLVAPGVSIRTLRIITGPILVSGTSFAAPMVAGVAALALSYKPDMTVDELENALLSSAKDIGASGNDNIYGHGLLDAGNTLRHVHHLKHPQNKINSVLSTINDYLLND